MYVPVHEDDRPMSMFDDITMNIYGVIALTVEACSDMLLQDTCGQADTPLM